VDGIVLTKLDGTAKGGIALAIAGELGIPVKLIGVGEALEDLRPFDADDFARALWALTGEPVASARMDLWVIWIVVAVAFAVGEILSLGLLPGAVRGRRAAGAAVDAAGAPDARPSRCSSWPRRCCSASCGPIAGGTPACRPPCARAPRRCSGSRSSCSRTSTTTAARARSSSRARPGPRAATSTTARSPRVRACEVVEIRGATALVTE
jgi:hypothetical protein